MRIVPHISTQNGRRILSATLTMPGDQEESGREFCGPILASSVQQRAAFVCMGPEGLTNV